MVDPPMALIKITLNQNSAIVKSWINFLQNELIVTKASPVIAILGIYKE